MNKNKNKNNFILHRSFKITAVNYFSMKMSRLCMYKSTKKI